MRNDIEDVVVTPILQVPIVSCQWLEPGVERLV